MDTSRRSASKENGRWDYYGYSQRTIDRDKFDEFKTRFYRLHGWDTTTGYLTRAILEPLGLGYVADELEVHGRLGAQAAETQQSTRKGYKENL